MEQDKNLTVWQRLTKTFGPNSLLNQDYPTYKFDKSELLKTTSKQDYEREKLQAQQTYYLGNQWAKIETNLYSQAIYYEPTRLATFYDLESMEFCLHGDTKIATPDGFITIKELADKGRDNEFIVYSYDHNEKRVVPAKARNAHYTRDEMTYKITFDDGNHIIATWEHQLMMRDGSFERVMNLKPGDSMMPFYRKSFYGKDKYHWVYSCNSKVGHHGWITEHNLIAEWFYRPLESNEVVHHRDFNGKNNNPENLLIMDKFEHQSYHAKINNEKLWANPEYREKMKIVARSKKNFSWNGRRAKENNPAYFSIPFDNIIETARQHKTLKKTAVALGVSHVKIQRDIVNAGYKDWSTFLEAYNIEKSKYSTAKAKGDQLAINHKIVSIEPFGIVPVYDITVPGYKNFATDTIFSHNTPEISAALDIYSEESTTVDENGYMLQIYSESKRIKSVLADLFNNVLDINTNLPMWIRNMTKYGDNFVYLKLDPEKGIVGCTQLPNIEIERFERGMAAKNINIEEPTENKGLRFKWKAKDMEFNTWEIAHFRLLGDDRKLPYGTSMLEKARRVWKQLCVSENTKVWTIDGYKKIKDIKAGEIIYSYDFDNNELISTKVKDCWQSGVKKTFNVRTRYNSIDITDDHQVLVYCDGEYTYKTLDEFKEGDKMIYPELDEYSEILSITENDDEPVWDLEVESELHNFIANGSVVHNCLAEDAMLIYRTSRAPERRVFKVFVGNMDDKDVEPYVQRVANKFKRDQVVDNATGNVDMRFNQMAVDQDYFIPVRDPAAPSPIDTLPGAANLGEIQDIEYIQKKLLTALRVPKAFLGFEEPVGGGKDLSLMDIRFARTINKIQKCALAELNKIAIIHLFLLGFEDELRSFTLNLTNPSSQADLLKIDVWKEKMLLYKDAVTPLQDNFAPVSASWAKKHILGFSDEEIRLDLQQQRIERAVAAELTNTATVITHTGLFDNIDKLYGTKSGSTQTVTATPPPPPGGEMGGDMGLPPMPPPPGPEPGGEAGVTPEGRTRDNLKILVENSNLIEEESYIDLSKARNSLGDIESQLNKLLND